MIISFGFNVWVVHNVNVWLLCVIWISYSEYVCMLAAGEPLSRINVEYNVREFSAWVQFIWTLSYFSSWFEEKMLKRFCCKKEFAPIYKCALCSSFSRVWNRDEICSGSIEARRRWRGLPSNKPEQTSTTCTLQNFVPIKSNA